MVSKKAAKAALEASIASARESADTTAFRREEWTWKSRTSTPDYSAAFSLDSTLLDAASQKWKGKSRELDYRVLGCGRCIVFDQLPGFVLLPAFLDTQQQKDLIKTCVNATTPPHRTNLDSHWQTPQQGIWSLFAQHIADPASSHTDKYVIQPRYKKKEGENIEKEQTKRLTQDNAPVSGQNYMEKVGEQHDPLPSATVSPMHVSEAIRKLRWSIIGNEYHWGTKLYRFDKPPMPMPDLIANICKSAVRTVPWQEAFSAEYPDWRPQAGIINFYQYKDALTAHVDHSEPDAASPLVSISLGQSAIFLVGGASRDDPPVPFLLKSGDIIIMSGQCRRAFHGVPRIIEGDLPAKLLANEGSEVEWDAVQSFLKGTRINVNVRQVFG